LSIGPNIGKIARPMTTLYRKYRPQKLSEIAGQDHIVNALSKQLETGKIHHAYLFTGPKGTGKTSTARIIAKAINCDKSKVKSKKVKGKSKLTFSEPCNKCNSCNAVSGGSYLDLIEIDAASNRGIDDVRELREGIKLAPSGGAYKVYIIDEAHMLTPEAFNALLKTLEEPPAHAVFILATTEPHKLPGTIVSRSQRFDFGRPSVDKIHEVLKKVVKGEDWKVADEGLIEIAKASDGAFRDAKVLLEKVGTVNPKADVEEVIQLIGKKNISQVLEILEIAEDKDTKAAILWLDEYVSGGGNIRVLNEAILELLRKTLLIKVGVGEKLVKEVSPEVYKGLVAYSGKITQQRLDTLIRLFTRAIEELAMATIPQLPLELALVEACEFEVGENGEEDTESDENSETQGESKPETKVQVKMTKKDDSKEDGKAKEKVGPKLNISEEELLRKVKRAWPKVVKEVKAKNKSLEVFLRSTKPESVEDDTISLKFYYRFHKDRVEDPKNRKILEEIIEKEVYKPVKIKGIMEEKSGSKAGKLEQKQADQNDPVQIFGKID
jgi:DNA polymerase-3 subunit gamma/tau